MLDFILKYWIQWLFGLIALGFATLARHYWKLYKKDKENEKQALLSQVHKDIEESREDIMKEVLEIRNEALETAIDRYNIVLEKLSKHEKDAMESYKAMFNSLSLQLKDLKKESEDQDNIIGKDLVEVHKGIDNLQNGILNIQGKEFKESCKNLLAQDHVITEIEYEEIVSDHEVYKSLGGNHRGDELFAMIQEKYRKNL